MIYNNYVQSSHSPIQWPHSLRLAPVSNWTITHHPALGIKCWPCQGIPPYRRDSRFQFGIETKTAHLLFVSENMWAPVGFGTKAKIPKPNIKHHSKQQYVNKLISQINQGDSLCAPWFKAILGSFNAPGGAMIDFSMPPKPAKVTASWLHLVTMPDPSMSFLHVRFV